MPFSNFKNVKEIMSQNELYTIERQVSFDWNTSHYVIRLTVFHLFPWGSSVIFQAYVEIKQYSIVLKGMHVFQ